MSGPPRERPGMRPPLVPLATLIGEEIRKNGKDPGEPVITYGHAGLAKRGEDYFLIKCDCQRFLNGPSPSFSVFAVVKVYLFIYISVNLFMNYFAW